MQKTPFMLIVGEEEEKTAPFLSVVTDKKERKCHRYNRRICFDSEREIKTLKHLQFNLNYKVIAIKAKRLSTSRRKKDAHRINNLIRGVVRLVGENVDQEF
jgi:hypothetical protein